MDETNFPFLEFKLDRVHLDSLLSLTNNTNENN